MKLIGISGSLRQNSYNTSLLKVVESLLPEGCQLQIHSCDLPLYNQELEDSGPPESVKQFKQAIDGSDALIISTPEYNHSFSGVMKNAIDWASRPAFESPLKDKPVAILSASPSSLGGSRAQTQLRSVLGATLSHVYQRELLLGNVHTLFEGGKLQDRATVARVEKFISGYLEWVTR